MTALKLGRTRRLSFEDGDRLVKEIARLPDLVGKVLEMNGAVAKVAEKYAKADDMFFIGRGILYPVALEGALKIKEVAYVHAEGYQAAELKHGPIALLSEKTPVVALLADIPGKEKTLGNVQECRARQPPDTPELCQEHIVACARNLAYDHNGLRAPRSGFLDAYDISPRKARTGRRSSTGAIASMPPLNLSTNRRAMAPRAITRRTAAPALRLVLLRRN